MEMISLGIKATGCLKFRFNKSFNFYMEVQGNEAYFREKFESRINHKIVIEHFSFQSFWKWLNKNFDGFDFIFRFFEYVTVTDHFFNLHILNRD